MSMNLSEDMIEIIETPAPLRRRPWEEMRLQTIFEGESRTQQSHRESVDINNIIKKFDRTGQLPSPTRPAQYGDVSDLNRPYGELIEESRNTLDQVGQFVESSQAEAKKKQAEADALEKAELEEFRKSKKTFKPEPPSTD